MYSISSLGYVWSEDRLVHYPDGRKPYIRRGRFLMQNPDRYGYMYVDLTRDAKHHRSFVHVMVCEAWHGPRPEGKWALHENGFNHDNRPENLRWGTPRENWEDSVRHGTARYGTKGGGVFSLTG